MKRDDITTLFPDATADQIKAVMKLNGDDINNAKQGLADLQAQYDEAAARITQLTADAEKYAADLEGFETTKKELSDLRAATALRDLREKISKETGVPVDLITATTEDECKAQASSILEFAKPSAYPTVRDGGEVHAEPKQDTRTQFAEWFNSQTK